jgi:hypothetical protein
MTLDRETIVGRAAAAAAIAYVIWIVVLFAA